MARTTTDRDAERTMPKGDSTGHIAASRNAMPLARVRNRCADRVIILVKGA